MPAADWLTALLDVRSRPCRTLRGGSRRPSERSSPFCAGGCWLQQEANSTSVFGRFQFQPLRWIDAPQTAMLCVVLPIVWAGAGPGCLLYLAALRTVPGELYEAAEIDGAGLVHKVFYITLPRLKYLIVIQFTAAVVAAFKGGTDQILAMTGDGPNDATMILALQIFIRTFMDLEFGLGAAIRRRTVTAGPRVR